MQTNFPANYSPDQSQGDVSSSLKDFSLNAEPVVRAVNDYYDTGLLIE